ncbi:hypothetical protein B2J93_7142 [Marssonina coronariae]|uniref:Uncharacterized protein n=1 Tax=Diplocarpon coronariae TaxID=2795749 RepID=A0A218YUZ3_9HELO|nr:hypothetical protein B2J93_7142 [Marssonina coronariae]
MRLTASLSHITFPNDGPRPPTRARSPTPALSTGVSGQKVSSPFDCTVSHTRSSARAERIVRTLRGPRPAAPVLPPSQREGHPRPDGDPPRSGLRWAGLRGGGARGKKQRGSSRGRPGPEEQKAAHVGAAQGSPHRARDPTGAPLPHRPAVAWPALCIIRLWQRRELAVCWDGAACEVSVARWERSASGGREIMTSSRGDRVVRGHRVCEVKRWACDGVRAGLGRGSWVHVPGLFFTGGPFSRARRSGNVEIGSSRTKSYSIPGSGRLPGEGSVEGWGGTHRCGEYTAGDDALQDYISRTMQQDYAAGLCSRTMQQDYAAGICSWNISARL